VLKPSGRKQDVIYCSRCGAENHYNNYRCDECGSKLRGEPRRKARIMRPVSSHLAEAILVTIFCCLPFGVVAIIYAAQVSGHLTSGNHAAAVRSSESAKTWCWVSFLCGIGVVVLTIFASIAGGS
jgi:DNA-directed RNA polymerase subunit RPC12/RpoP